MADLTKIEWADSTFNPIEGCTKVSEGCANCYAETLAKRYGHKVWGPAAPRRTFGDKRWAEPLRWNAAAAAEEGDVQRYLLVLLATLLGCFALATVTERRKLFWKNTIEALLDRATKFVPQMARG